MLLVVVVSCLLLLCFLKATAATAVCVLYLYPRGSPVVAGVRTRRAQERPIRTCIVFVDHVQNLQIHAVRAKYL